MSSDTVVGVDDDVFINEGGVGEFTGVTTYLHT